MTLITMEDPTRKLSFSAVADEQPTSAQCEPGRLKVFVRLRALGSSAHESSDMHATQSTISIRTTKSTAQAKSSMEETSFSFDGVFDATATQAEVFEAAMLPQVQGLFSERDTLTFAYGITNAGKTYTIQGNGTGSENGALPRAFEVIFAAIDNNAARAGGGSPELSGAAAAAPVLDPTSKYEVRASFLEVYGNDAFDLLVAPEKGAVKRQTLRLKEEKGQVLVEGLREVEISSYASAMEALQLGWTNRQSASNGLNDLSSRSHAVLSLRLLTTKAGARAPTATRMCVVDLAGAERQKKTQAKGTRLIEANSINKVMHN